MKFVFRSEKIRELYIFGRHRGDYPADVVQRFANIMSYIGACEDERALYAMKSLHFEKLLGKPGKLGKRSLRLGKQWRLIVSLEYVGSDRNLVIWDIEKHIYRV